MNSFRAFVILAAMALVPAAQAGDEDGGDDASSSEVDVLGGGGTTPEAPLSTGTPSTLSELAPLGETDAVAGVEAVRLLSLALDRISALEILLASSGDDLDREAAMAELAQTRQTLHAALAEVGRLQEDSDLRAWLRSEGLVTTQLEEPATPADVQEPTGPGLPSARLSAIVSSIERVSFTEGKMQVLTRELAEETVTSEQASALVELFSFSRDRVEALVFLHPRLVDQENFEQLLSSLKFESDRETVRNTLGLEG